MIRWPLSSLVYDETEKWLGAATKLWFVRIGLVDYQGTKR